MYNGCKDPKIKCVKGNSGTKRTSVDCAVAECDDISSWNIKTNVAYLGFDKSVMPCGYLKDLGR